MGIISQPKSSLAWVRQEKQLHDDGCSRVPGSGNGDRKGDNKGRNFLIEAKTTKKASRTISAAEFAKCEEEARREDRLPLMQIQLKDQKQLAVMRWEDLVELAEAAGWEL